MFVFTVSQNLRSAFSNIYYVYVPKQITVPMRYINILIAIAFYLYSLNANCLETSPLPNKIIFGVTGGITQNSCLSGDIYGGYRFKNNSMLYETNFGYTFFKNSTRFDGFDNLFYASHGVFGEFNYLLTPRLFTGARASINMNFVDGKSQDNYELQSTKDAPTYFTGMAVFGQIGYNIFCCKSIDLRLKAQLGFQKYIIGTGAIYISNDISPIPAEYRDTYARESQLKLLGNLSIGIIIK